ncbi:MAG: hypothetical protein QOG64_2922 [Acidimicrobiaceae bacterium]|nr:hypothetical protein [Acidimicrobiaceae bacterium]
MTATTFTEAMGRPVLSRATAERLGEVKHLIVDVGQRRITLLAVGRGRRSQLVDWEALSGLGPDAVMVESEQRVRDAADDRDKAAAAGKLDLLGKRVLTDRGFTAGTVTDIVFEAETGMVTEIRTESGPIAAERLRGAGSYAVVVAAS